jgi:protoporphyrinogen oxidase
MAINCIRKTVVLGGGISGLTAARTAGEMLHDYVLLEQCPTLGGLTRTIEVGDFCFDYTGHFLHLSRYPTPAHLPFAGLDNGDWQRIHRRSCCYVAGKFIDAPIQYNLGQLPPEMLRECIKSYDARPQSQLQSSDHLSFRDFIVQGFGQYLADLFLIPQNEKTMATSLERLSMRAVKRFFPPPNEALVRAGMGGEAPAANEYNSSFWYPKTGGIGALVKGLSSGLNRHHVLTNQQVASLDLENRSLGTSTGETFAWNHLFSSLPLKTLCQASNDPELKIAEQELSHSSTISFNIGLNCPLPAEFEGMHWIYVPDRALPFYRVGFYSNISTGTCTPGHSALYVEVGVPGEELAGIDLVNDLQPRVMAGLENLGWIDRRQVACIATHVVRHAYVHHTEQRERLMEQVLGRLGTFDIHPIGRYGLWDYTGMEDSMESARTTVREVLNGIQHCDTGTQRSAQPGAVRKLVPA